MEDGTVLVSGEGFKHDLVEPHEQSRQLISEDAGRYHSISSADDEHYETRGESVLDETAEVATTMLPLGTFILETYSQSWKPIFFWKSVMFLDNF
jgi:hypothetical protein